jgi:hypothetical protein
MAFENFLNGYAHTNFFAHGALMKRSNKPIHIAISAEADLVKYLTALLTLYKH